jgi:hypothetical protein
MFYYTRSIILFLYRLFFVALFFTLGISGAGIVVLEYYFGYQVISTESYADREALFMTLGFMSLLGFSTALLMIYLMHEKRSNSSDRRKMDRPLDFPDRRSNIDRRAQQDEPIQQQEASNRT